MSNVEKRQNDLGLLTAWQTGNARAGEILIRRHYGLVMRVLAGSVDDDTCRDLSQATFETLCKRRNAIRDPEAFKGFLIGIARRKLIAHYRKRVKHDFDPVSDSGASPVPEATVSSLCARKERERMIVGALRSLSLDDQILLELSGHENLTSAEIAAVFGIAPPTVRRRIADARARLDKKIEALERTPKPHRTREGNLFSWIESVRGKTQLLGENHSPRS